MLWAGTDDGNLQVSRDGGATWTNVAARVPGVPKGTYVSRVEASRTGEGAAYVAFDGHRSNDFGVYLFFTSDYGQTWKSVSANLPAGGTLSVVREHPKNADVLFAGTERGLWVSWDRGSSWTPLRGKNLPTVPVDDIQVHPREGDLVLGTHGRGVWILDDAAPLVSLPQARGQELHLFPIPTATEWRLYDHKGNTGHKLFLAPNPPEGALGHVLARREAGREGRGQDHGHGRRRALSCARSRARSRRSGSTGRAGTCAASRPSSRRRAPSVASEGRRGGRWCCRAATRSRSPRPARRRRRRSSSKTTRGSP